jgi:hypothetical protein
MNCKNLLTGREANFKVSEEENDYYDVDIVEEEHDE